MRLSDDKVNHLSKVVVTSLASWEAIDFVDEENDVRLVIKAGLEEGLALIDQVEEKVHKTLLSYSRKIPEGSREWDVMYAKAFEEELSKIAPAKE